GGHEAGNAKNLRGGLDATSEIDGVPSGSVFQSATAAGIADLGSAGVNSDAQTNDAAESLGPLAVDGGQFIGHRQGGLHGPVSMLCDLRRRIPHRGEAIAVVVDHNATVVHDLIRQAIENVGQQVVGFAGPNPLRYFGEAAKVGEEQ